MPEKKFKQIIANETNLVHILDNLKEGIIAHDLERRIFFFNREAERITGYSREEVLHRDCHEAFGAPFCGERCMFLGDQINLPDSKEYPLNIFTKDGEIRNVEMSVSALKDETGKVFGVLAFIKDITEVINCRFRTRDLNGYANIVGHSGKMLKVFEQIHDLSGYDFPVHIYGETGTGKELVAEAIHNQSLRAGAPFVPINCGALPEGLIESELFGHVKGAFSGAIRDKKGRFEMADGGTIFLDEVAELSKGTQVNLLRFLQKGRFEKVGGEQTVSVNVRIISATNTDLKLAVKNKKFREDLYYRLNVIPIHLPPLRDRKNDIPLLARYFLDQIPITGDQKPMHISREALSLMMDYDWPGNVRQLQNALQFAIVKSSGASILPEHLPMELAGMPGLENRRGPLKKLAPDSVQKALEKTGGNKAKAARLLGVGRATLYRFLQDHPVALPLSLEKE
jgi:sigma-54 dependent transcriptional regulator, acetoin dehydrogenase operon transcriptional activator AcoR